MRDFPRRLSKTSIKALRAICKTVAEKCSSNSMSTEMAKGIATAVSEYGSITERQAVWICRNADYWHLDRPDELADVKVPKGKKNEPNSGSGSPLAPASSRSLADWQRDIERKAYPNLNWALSVITTSENQLDPGGRSVRKEGERIRMVPIAVPPTWQGGIFEAVDKAEERHRLAQQVERTISHNYGVVMPAYLAALVAEREPLTKELPATVFSFAHIVGAEGDSWQRRLASKFGLVLTGARLLARYDIGPWTEGRAEAAVKAIYRASRAASLSIPELTAAFLKRLEALAKDQRLFPRPEKGQVFSPRQKDQMLGIRRTIAGHDTLALPHTEFEKLVEPSAVADYVLRALADQGRIVKGADGNLRRQIQVIGLSHERQRYICIKLA